MEMNVTDKRIDVNATACKVNDRSHSPATTYTEEFTIQTRVIPTHSRTNVLEYTRMRPTRIWVYARYRNKVECE